MLSWALLKDFLPTKPEQPELKHVRIIQSIVVRLTSNQSCTTLESKPNCFSPDFLKETRTLGIANVKIQGNQWRTAELISCGQQLDKIYSAMGQMSFLMLENGNCIPESQFVELRVDGPHEGITYDIVEIATPLPTMFTFRGYQHVLTKPGSETFINLFF